MFSCLHFVSSFDLSTSVYPVLLFAWVVPHVCDLSFYFCATLCNSCPMATMILIVSHVCHAPSNTLNFSVTVPCLWHWLICSLSLTSNTMPHVHLTLSNSCLLLYCCPMSVALSPVAVLLVILCPCPFLSVQQLSTVMLLSHVCGTWSTSCLTCTISCPMSISLCPTAVYCYVAVPCLWHSVHKLSYLYNIMPHVHFSLSNSRPLLCCCPTSVAVLVH